MLISSKFRTSRERNVMTATGPLTTKVIDWQAPEALGLAERVIQAGECAVIPTETIYGLTCRAFETEAVESLYSIKGRELTKPSAVFVADVAGISAIADTSGPGVERVAGRFLPGPLTIILHSLRRPITGVVGADGKIGIRVSTHPFVTGLCQRIGQPLLATSANRAGAADCRTQQEVLSTFRGVVPLIIVAPLPLTERATTVVDLTGAVPVLVREGTIPFADVLNCAEGSN
jgi:L-threonylcarbamoyladenylate synthase